MEYGSRLMKMNEKEFEYEFQLISTYSTFHISAKNPNPQGPSPTQSNPVKIRSKGTGADTKILWATTPPHPPTHNF